MSRYIPENIREIVTSRALRRCEYCRVYERHSFLTFHIEHIISLKHGGSSEPSNLAYACPICNIKFTTVHKKKEKIVRILGKKGRK